MGDPLQVVADPLKAVPEVFRRVVVEQCDLRSVAANDRAPVYRDLSKVALSGEEKDFIAIEAYINVAFGKGVASGGEPMNLRIDPFPPRFIQVGGSKPHQIRASFPGLVSERYT